jgi:hypothetical protein
MDRPEEQEQDAPQCGTTVGERQRGLDSPGASGALASRSLSRDSGRVLTRLARGIAGGAVQAEGIRSRCLTISSRKMESSSGGRPKARM